MLTQLGERDYSGKPAFQTHIDPVPAWRGRVALGIVVMILAIESGGVGVAFLHHFHDRDDARHLGARVVQEDPVATLHLVPKHVARLKIANSVPKRGLPRGRGQILDTEGAGLGLHQPVAHRSIPSSVTTASSSTSCAAGVILSTC